MDELQKLVGCGTSWAEEKALLVMELTDNYKSGALTAEEYKELLTDISNMDIVSGTSADLEFKSMLVAGISALISAA
jgi:hypothetical protein